MFRVLIEAFLIWIPKKSLLLAFSVSCLFDTHIFRSLTHCYKISIATALIYNLVIEARLISTRGLRKRLLAIAIMDLQNKRSAIFVFCSEHTNGLVKSFVKICN